MPYKSLNPSHSLNNARLVDVLLPLPFSQLYTYRLPETVSADIGNLVHVPWGKHNQKIIVGLIWQNNVSPPKADVKDIVGSLTLDKLPEEMSRFIAWVADYNMVAMGQVLKMVIAPWLQAKKAPVVNTIQIASNLIQENLSNDQRHIANILADNNIKTKTDLSRRTQLSLRKINHLFQIGMLVMSPEQNFKLPQKQFNNNHFTTEQKNAANHLSQLIGQQKFQPLLLKGVTGSGKTEVYFQGIAETLKMGKQSLILLPEIALGPQWLERFQLSFGYRPPSWNSDTPIAQKRLLWQQILNNQCPVIVGARSALFLPFKKLGLIVIDEEHDNSFKQEEGTIYHARDMAIVRAQIAQCPIVLSSATPSMETIFNVQKGRYQQSLLKNRHSDIPLPKIQLVDMTLTPPPRQHWISPPLFAAIQETLLCEQQILLFLNRRGYAPLVLCRNCGFRLRCPNCSSWLVQHRQQQQNLCHYCGYHTPIQQECPSCQQKDQLTTCGPGVEKIAEEVKTLFPKARMMISTSDTLASPSQVADFLEKVEHRQVDIIIGTQVIAKGHHFPLLTLVGVIDGDAGLQGGDLRASEKTWQLLQQVAGRAGRAEYPGRVFIQTYEPQTPLMQALAAYDEQRFFDVEWKSREVADMPPFSKLTAIILSSPDHEMLLNTCHKMQRCAPIADGLIILGPAPAPLAMIRGQYRQRFLIRTARSIKPQFLVKNWINSINIPSNVRVTVDIDPYSFL